MPTLNIPSGKTDVNNYLRTIYLHHTFVGIDLSLTFHNTYMM